MLAPFSPSQRVLLLCEGPNDVAFFKSLCSKRGLPELEITHHGGKENLRPFLKAIKNAAGFSQVVSLGIARDSDLDPAAAIQSVHDALVAADLSAPTAALSVNAGRPGPAVTLMIVPDVMAIGGLEELVFRALAADAAIKCVDEYFNCLVKAGLPHEIGSKARMHVFLASRPELTGALRWALEKGYVPMESPAFDEAATFVELITA